MKILWCIWGSWCIIIKWTKHIDNMKYCSLTNSYFFKSYDRKLLYQLIMIPRRKFKQSLKKFCSSFGKTISFWLIRILKQKKGVIGSHGVSFFLGATFQGGLWEDPLIFRNFFYQKLLINNIKKSRILKECFSAKTSEIIFYAIVGLIHPPSSVRDRVNYWLWSVVLKYWG